VAGKNARPTQLLVDKSSGILKNLHEHRAGEFAGVRILI
jgi:hypothetical protein